MLLDDEKFNDWLVLCQADGFRYVITAYSPEIRSEMVWLDHDATGLKALFDGLPQHIRVGGSFRRHLGAVISLGVNGDASDFRSSVAVYHTSERGESKLYALATYYDSLVRVKDETRLARRKVHMDTRLVEFGPHVII